MIGFSPRTSVGAAQPLAVEVTRNPLYHGPELERRPVEDDLRNGLSSRMRGG